ncbi:histone chaperone rtt106-like [Cynara cardunculus var. scolymus]|uniref:histone chaperone rtt106-like n=1 Tax=Cynara cardunculus var. scolymus TaxID=59895 RepID=UPI000D626F79|nr:histone chaperone rtt106-like [Cynara cardunculus var. scolymus]
MDIIELSLDNLFSSYVDDKDGEKDFTTAAVVPTTQGEADAQRAETNEVEVVDDAITTHEAEVEVVDDAVRADAEAHDEDLPITPAADDGDEEDEGEDDFPSLPDAGKDLGGDNGEDDDDDDFTIQQEEEREVIGGSLALVAAEKGKRYACRSLKEDSEESNTDKEDSGSDSDLNDIKQAMLLLTKTFEKKFYKKPSSNNLRTLSSSRRPNSSSRKPEYKKRMIELKTE